MHQRSQLDVTRRQGNLWLRRKYWPAPNSDMLMQEDFLARLYDSEHRLSDGRFLNHVNTSFPYVIRLWFDQEDEEERAYVFARMLDWIRETNAPWNLEVCARERIGCVFSFDDPIVSFMFMHEFSDYVAD